MNKLEKMYFGEEDSSQGQAAPSPPDGPILTPYSFAGLFIITGIVIFLAFLGSETEFFLANTCCRGKVLGHL